jgi:hypothetical protein
MYNPSWRNNTTEYITAERPGQLILKATMNKPVEGQSFGWQQYIADKLKGRKQEIASFDKIVVRARSANAEPAKMKIVLLTKDGSAFSTSISITNQFQNIEIPFSSFKSDSALLLPRPYPGFQSLMFKSAVTEPLRMNNIDKLQVVIGGESLPAGITTTSIELESIFLQKSKQ